MENENEKNMPEDLLAADAKVSENTPESPFSEAEVQKKETVIPEELMKGTMDTVNQVKETLKTVNLKDDALVAKGFIKEMWADPIGKIRAIAANPPAYMKVAILLMGVWLAAVLLNAIFNYLDFFQYNYFNTVLTILFVAISPLVIVTVMSIIIYTVKKEKSHSILSIITIITIAHLPSIFAALISVLIIFGSFSINFIMSFSALCSVLSAILVFFAIQALMSKENEDNGKFFRTYVLIMSIYYVAHFVLRFFHISL